MREIGPGVAVWKVDGDPGIDIPYSKANQFSLRTEWVNPTKLAERSLHSFRLDFFPHSYKVVDRVLENLSQGC